MSTGTALIDVNVLDLATSTMQPSMTVVGDGPRITHVSGPDGLQLAADVRQILPTDTYVMPGLWDMHAHAMTSIREDLHPSAAMGKS